MNPALLHTPAQPTGDGLLLTHGAGGNCRSELLVAVANAFQNAGLTVFRYDMPFRERRKFGPPTPARAAEDRDGLRSALSELRTIVPGRLFAGGHSYGGRQASLLLADEPAVAAGLLLLSYPLHPPKKPHDLRTAHFPRVKVPAFFVHGTNDPFGSIAEITGALPSLGGRSQLAAIDGAGHDLERGRFDLAANVVTPFLRLTQAG